MNALKGILYALALLLALSPHWGCQTDTSGPVSGPSVTGGPTSEFPGYDKTKYVGSGGVAPGTQNGTDSSFCITTSDTWVGSDSTTYGDMVIVWGDAIPSNMTVTIHYLNTSTAEFLPSMEFPGHQPEVHLSYKYSGITDEDAKHMRIFYLNQATNLWEPVNNNPLVDAQTQTFIFTVKHFSIYAFGR